MQRLAIFILIIVGFPLLSNAQIFLDNPSFEDEPADATVPHGWFPCKSGTTPDILPGYWGVYSEPSDGETFVGLITRVDGSWEAIGQRFSAPLEENVCYKFSVDLSKSENYSGYNNGIQLRIWISNKKCKKDQMVFESEVIDNPDWETFSIEFTPEKTAKYILIEAHHPTQDINYKGNIMIDNISSVIYCNRA